ncbi:hypothetical protein ABC347_12075 [Sphingomonas sp. 1P06PA]|uniref:hypothetical protein n=1 Tax=Sphingomonas sp. 1P06PA TaxID=554121 RepID=UPI0039A57F6C
MTYHELKNRDLTRLAWIATGFGLTLLLALIFRDTAETVANLIPTRSGPLGFFPAVAMLAIMFIIILFMMARMLMGTPASDAEFLARNTVGYQSRTIEVEIDCSVFEADDPDFQVTTWQVLKRRFAARQ